MHARLIKGAGVFIADANVDGPNQRHTLSLAMFVVSPTNNAGIIYRAVVISQAATDVLRIK
jgi:hypothetical protein